MTEQELRALAVRGLSARLIELDEERARILGLLGRWDTASTPTVRRKVRRVPREADRVDSTVTQVAVARTLVPPVQVAEPEVARILPRRNRAQSRLPAADPTPVLPPMPRLVKARAS